MCDVRHKAAGWWWWGQHGDNSKDTGFSLIPNSVGSIAGYISEIYFSWWSKQNFTHEGRTIRADILNIICHIKHEISDNNLRFILIYSAYLCSFNLLTMFTFCSYSTSELLKIQWNVRSFPGLATTLQFIERGWKREVLYSDCWPGRHFGESAGIPILHLSHS